MSANLETLGRLVAWHASAVGSWTLLDPENFGITDNDTLTVHDRADFVVLYFRGNTQVAFGDPGSGAPAAQFANGDVLRVRYTGDIFINGGDVDVVEGY